MTAPTMARLDIANWKLVSRRCLTSGKILIGRMEIAQRKENWIWHLGSEDPKESCYQMLGCVWRDFGHVSFPNRMIYSNGSIMKLRLREVAKKKMISCKFGDVLRFIFHYPVPVKYSFRASFPKAHNKKIVKVDVRLVRPNVAHAR
jgi:hypothetical protein